MSSKKRTIIWKTKEAHSTMASFRYRCALPAHYLKKLGWDSVILEKEESISDFNDVAAVVFVKTFSESDLKLAARAKAAGVPVIIDLCDNVFFEKYPAHQGFSKFDEMLKYSCLIVTTGEELAVIITKRAREPVKIIIIPDQIETLEVSEVINTAIMEFRCRRFKYQENSNLKVYFANLYAKLTAQVRILARKVDKKRRRDKILQALKLRSVARAFPVYESTNNKTYDKQIIWFGNAGGSFSNFGIPAILEVSEHLIAAFKKVPFKLVVVSNNHERFVELIQPLPIPVEYRQWDMIKIFDDLASSDLCIVPNAKDDFSICKSPNRTLLALSLGVPVVATYIPSLEKISKYIVLDDWEKGIVSYLTEENKVKTDLAGATTVLKNIYSGEAIARNWDDALKGIFTENRNTI